jgi:hypothetical protein
MLYNVLNFFWGGGSYFAKIPYSHSIHMSSKFRWQFCYFQWIDSKNGMLHTHAHTKTHIVPVKSSSVFFCNSLNILWIFKLIPSVHRRLTGKLCELIYSLCRNALNNSSIAQKWRSVIIFNDAFTNGVLFTHSPLWNFINVHIINSASSCVLHQNTLRSFRKLFWNKPFMYRAL